MKLEKQFCDTSTEIKWHVRAKQKKMFFIQKYALNSTVWSMYMFTFFFKWITEMEKYEQNTKMWSFMT